MSRFFASLSICLLLASCLPVTRLHTYTPGEAPVARNLNASALRCAKWDSYVPEKGAETGFYTRNLRVNFHVMDNAAGNAHRPPDSVRVFLRALLEAANAALDTNFRNWRSPEGTPVLPKLYRYVLTPQPVAGDDGIYFHYDDALCYFVSQGKNQNNQKRDVIEKYGIGADSIVNIFVLTHHPDSMKSASYRAGIQGIALGTNLKIAGALEFPEPPGRSAGNLNHEMGHVLGLSHAWLEDGCPDTDNHPNKCWTWSKDPPCRDIASNNVMDYNGYQNAMTPCQIARVQAAFSKLNNPIRARLEPDWRRYQPDKTIVIRDSVVWAGARDLRGDLIIAPGGRLRISCRVAMPPGSRILVQPGGYLWLEGAWLHNDCGQTWKGIQIAEKGREAGHVACLLPALLENTKKSGGGK